MWRSGNRGGGCLRQLVEVGDRGCCRSTRSGVAAAIAGGRGGDLETEQETVDVVTRPLHADPLHPIRLRRLLLHQQPLDFQQHLLRARPNVHRRPRLFIRLQTKNRRNVCTTPPLSPIQSANHGAADSTRQPRGAEDTQSAQSTPAAHDRPLTRSPASRSIPNRLAALCARLKSR